MQKQIASWMLMSMLLLTACNAEIPDKAEDASVQDDDRPECNITEREGFQGVYDLVLSSAREAHPEYRKEDSYIGSVFYLTILKADGSAVTDEATLYYPVIIDDAIVGYVEGAYKENNMVSYTNINGSFVDELNAALEKGDELIIFYEENGDSMYCMNSSDIIMFSYGSSLEKDVTFNGLKAGGYVLNKAQLLRPYEP